MSVNISPVAVMKEESNKECRICLTSLKKNSKRHCLFDAWDPPWDGMEANVADDLYRLTNIEVTKTDILSKVICGPCYEQLQQACIFVKLAHRNNQQLQKGKMNIQIEISTTPSKSIWPQPIQLDTNIDSNIYNSEMVVEVKQEILSEEEMDRMDCRSSEMCLDIKVEPEEIVPQNPVFSSIPMDTSTIKSNVYLYEEYLEEVKEEPDSVPSDLPLECMLCSKNFNSVSGLKAHVIAYHSYKTVKRSASGEASPAKRARPDKYICVTCHRKFATSTDLMVHETCHSSVSCYACKKNFDTFGQLTRHRRRCAASAPRRKDPVKTLDDVKRVQQAAKNKPLTKQPKLTCPSCPEQFLDIYYLNIHREICHSPSNNGSFDTPLNSEQPPSNHELSTEALDGVEEIVGMENDKAVDSDLLEKVSSGDVNIVVERQRVTSMGMGDKSQFEASWNNDQSKNSADFVNIVVERVGEPLDMVEQNASNGECTADEIQTSDKVNTVLEIERMNDDSVEAAIMNETGELNLENILSGNVIEENTRVNSVNIHFGLGNECENAANKVMDSESVTALDDYLEASKDECTVSAKNANDLPDLSHEMEDNKDAITQAARIYCTKIENLIQHEVSESNYGKDNLDLEGVNINLEGKVTLCNEKETSDVTIDVIEKEIESSDSAQDITNEKSPSEESESLESIFGVIPCGK